VTERPVALPAVAKGAPAMATGPPIFEDASFDPEMTGIMVEAYEKALPMASRHRTAAVKEFIATTDP
jgi:hypothetical protein